MQCALEKLLNGKAATTAYGRLPKLGETVHYCLPADNPWSGECRAAIVVRTFDDTMTVNLQVFADGEHDIKGKALTVFAQSVVYDSAGNTPNTWHWPELD